MNKESRDSHLTPSEFYRTRRPEYFSDSEVIQEVKLPREHLSFELSEISKNQKQDAFETLARRLAEKFISPNLIPQVGPTGGGDGKTDSETHPVSKVISDRWFVPENGWNNNENWAFAISAKAEWKSKVKKDVDKIVKTNRGYSKIYFISNQLIPSKKKKDYQDTLKKEFSIDVIILDREWILEKIYSNNLVNLAVDSLNLSDVYKNEKVKIGMNDAFRIERLKEIEDKIANTKRYFEYDYQLIEDALESAIITRMLEKPKDEVIGKFERVVKLAEKLNNIQQLARVHYQKAWTHINWYDEYREFILEFRKFKLFAKDCHTALSLELYFNLLNLLRSISHNDTITEINDTEFKLEEEEYRAILNHCSTIVNKPTTSLIAKTFNSFLNLYNLLFEKKDTSVELKKLSSYIKDSKPFIEFPFESFKKMVEVFGEVLPNSEEYDNLINQIAERSEERASEISSGEIFLTRGFQKLSNKYYKDSLIYFGRSVQKLAKEEKQEGFYLALMALKEAYINLGLHWAANNCIIAASSITIKEWYSKGILSKRFYNCIKEGLKNELFIGRIPQLLCWYELFRVISPHFEEDLSDENETPIAQLIDGCLSVRLLNTSFNTWSSFSCLPDIFEKESLFLSQDTTLYLLGYTELLEEEHFKDLHNGKSLDEVYSLFANQPFKHQMAYETNLVDEKTTEFKSIILGTELTVTLKSNFTEVSFAETLLAFLESFLATSFDSAFPNAEKIKLIIEDVTSEDWNIDYEIIEARVIKVKINFSKFDSFSNEIIHEILIRVSSILIAKYFILRHRNEYLDKLFNEEELHERQSIVIEQKKFFRNIFGDNPKIFLNSWSNSDSIKVYKIKRKENPITTINNLTDKIDDDNSERKLQNTKHNHTKVSSIFDNYLWDEAHWQAFGFFESNEIPFGIFLGFENGDLGRKIFEDWILQFGRIDKHDEIILSIIRGIDQSNPNKYRIHIRKKVEKEIFDNRHFIFATSRFHEMTPSSPSNLTNIINGFSLHKQFVLVPASFSTGGSVIPFLDLGILKKSLLIRYAWEIGENDPDSVAILKDDIPFIPENIQDAPVVKLLKNKQSK